jgi:hypothetical protein
MDSNNAAGAGASNPIKIPAAAKYPVRYPAYPAAAITSHRKAIFIAVPGGTRLDPTAIMPRTDPMSHLKFSSASAPPNTIPAAILGLPKIKPATAMHVAETRILRQNRLPAASGSIDDLLILTAVIHLPRRSRLQPRTCTQIPPPKAFHSSNLSCALSSFVEYGRIPRKRGVDRAGSSGVSGLRHLKIEAPVPLPRDRRWNGRCRPTFNLQLLTFNPQ